MPTPEQIKDALHQIEHEYSGFPDARDRALGYAHDALESVAELTADRDEWRTRHENARTCWQRDKETLGAQRDAALAKLARVLDVLSVANRYDTVDEIAEEIAGALAAEEPPAGQEG